MYNIKCVFHYEPRSSTAFCQILYDTAMIERDFKKAQEERMKQEMLLKNKQQLARTNNNSRMRRRK